jgi:hypothetical protein
MELVITSSSNIVDIEVSVLWDEPEEEEGNKLTQGNLSS